MIPALVDKQVDFGLTPKLATMARLKILAQNAIPLPAEYINRKLEHLYYTNWSAPWWLDRLQYRCPSKHLMNSTFMQSYSKDLIWHYGLGFCSTIKFLNFSASTKPWNYQLHFNFFAPLVEEFEKGTRWFVSDTITIPFEDFALWTNYPYILNMHDHKKLISLSQVRVLLQETEFVQRFAQVWMQALTTYNIFYSIARHTIFYVMPTKATVTGAVLHMFNEGICHDCDFWSIFIARKTIKTSFHDTSSKLIWSFDDTIAHYYVDIIQFFSECHLEQFDFNHWQFRKYMLRDWHLKNILALAQAMHLHSSTPNSTFTTCYCRHASLTRSHPIISDFCAEDPVFILRRHTLPFSSWFRMRLAPGNGEYLPFSLDDPANNFRFISCGRPPQTALPFDALVSVFQFKVWICTFLMILILVPLAAAGICNPHIFTFNSKLKLTRVTFIQRIKQVFSKIRVISTLKCLLEQGDPFTEQETCILSFRWVVASTLLVCIVISNAYKNDNVYKVIAPRQIVHYHTFRQLVEDKFAIFSDAQRKTFWGGACSVGCTLNYSRHPTNPHKATIRETSCNSSVHRKTGVLLKCMDIDSRVGTHFQRQSSKIVEYVYNNSKLIPGVDKDLLASLGRTNVFLFRQMIVVDRLKFEAAHDARAWNTLKECNKTALILPETTSAQFYAKLNFERGQNDVYIGKEVMFGSVMGVYFSGNLPETILQRLKALEMSGVMKFWNRFVVDTVIPYRQIRRSQAVSPPPATLYQQAVSLKPTMSGNVVVIFVALFMGLAVSAIFVLFERCDFRWLSLKKLKLKDIRRFGFSRKYRIGLCDSIRLLRFKNKLMFGIRFVKKRVSKCRKPD